MGESNWLTKLNEEQKNKARFLQELERLINRYSLENGSGTPDYILAQYLLDCLNTFDRTIGFRERWYGRTSADARVTEVIGESNGS